MFGFLKKKFGKTEQAESGQPASADDVDQGLPAEVPATADEAPVTESSVTVPAATAPVAAEPAAPAAPATAVSVPVAAAQAPDQLAVEALVPEALVPETEQPAALALETEAAAPRRSWGDRLKAGLARTRQQLGGGLASLFGRRKIDEDLLEELESTLLMADCGVDATQHLINDLRLRWKRDRLETADQLQKALADGLHAILTPLEQPLVIGTQRPFIIMIAGVNGAGKTTSIGKLAKYFQNQGKSVLLAAGDTFRAAAREQLMTWGARNNVAVVAQDGGDAAAVIFDAISAARARNIDIVLADTAGRLPTQPAMPETRRRMGKNH